MSQQVRGERDRTKRGRACAAQNACPRRAESAALAAVTRSPRAAHRSFGALKIVSVPCARSGGWAARAGRGARVLLGARDAAERPRGSTAARRSAPRAPLLGRRVTRAPPERSFASCIALLVGRALVETARADFFPLSFRLPPAPPLDSSRPAGRSSPTSTASTRRARSTASRTSSSSASTSTSTRRRAAAMVRREDPRAGRDSS
jgi:hypothetical protein